MSFHDHNGRDSYVIAKALAYAIATIQHLRSSRQEYGDMADMCGLFCRLSPSAAAHIVASVIYHTGLTPDIFADLEEKNGAGLAEQNFYRESYLGELCELAAMHAEVDAHKAKLSHDAASREI
jgi:hypothetical protein